MSKTITDSQILGELGETAIKKLVLEMQFIYDSRGRLEAGTDGIIELRDPKSGARTSPSFTAIRPARPEMMI
jgi:hypothetical protein